MSERVLQEAMAAVPAGGWAVGVSGGADSVALLLLLLERSDLRLHVAHLDHRTRGAASAADAEFVRTLAQRCSLPCTVRLLDEMETDGVPLSRNRSARFRAARLAFFRDVVRSNRLNGVVLAHHADDQAETVLQRLIRGSGVNGLVGMAASATVGGLTILRPLLGVGREALRQYLRGAGQPWREDESNTSDVYLRNRLRRMLQKQPELTNCLLGLAAACSALREWTRREAPALPVTFDVAALRELPELLAQESARRWLVARGAPPGELSPAVLRRLIDLDADSASAPRSSFPGNLLVRRRAGHIWAERLAQA